MCSLNHLTFSPAECFSVGSFISLFFLIGVTSQNVLQCDLAKAYQFKDWIKLDAYLNSPG